MAANILAKDVTSILTPEHYEHGHAAIQAPRRPQQSGSVHNQGAGDQTEPFEAALALVPARWLARARAWGMRID